MGKLYGSTAILLVAAHYTASCIKQQITPHLALVQHQLYCLKLRYQAIIIAAYEVVDVRSGRGFGWYSTADAAYTSALLGGFRAN